MRMIMEAEVNDLERLMFDSGEKNGSICYGLYGAFAGSGLYNFHIMAQAWGSLCIKLVSPVYSFLSGASRRCFSGTLAPLAEALRAK